MRYRSASISPGTKRALSIESYEVELRDAGGEVGGFAESIIRVGASAESGGFESSLDESFNIGRGF
jgi:hypothetical protein